MKPVVFIDWGGTLSDQLLWHSFVDGSPKERYLRDRITKEVFESQDEYLQAWMRGELTSEEFVRDIAELLGEDERVMWFRFVDDCKTTAYGDLGYLDAMAELKPHAQVVLATDNGEHFRRFVTSRLKLDDIFDDMLISADLAATKRAPETFFAAYLDAIRSGRGLLIDDSEDGCRRFMDIGGEAIQINSDVSTHRALSDALKWAQSLEGFKNEDSRFKN